MDSPAVRYIRSKFLVMPAIESGRPGADLVPVASSFKVRKDLPILAEYSPK
jgi:hypothetical protein